ncbi:MAG: hypothetical protein ABMA15_00760 [Vicinamibacterales bacterium]
MTEQSSNPIPPPVPVPGPMDSSGDILSDWDRILPLTPPKVLRPRDPLQEGIEEILERLRASDARRAGAMARLEVMMEQWPEQESEGRSTDEEPAGSGLARIQPAQMAEPVRTALTVLAAQSSERPEWLQVREARTAPVPPTVSLESWSPEARERIHAVPSRDAESADADPDEVVQILASRVDSVELAVVVANEELARAKARTLALERRSSITLAVLLLSIVLAGFLMFELFRQVNAASPRATAAPHYQPGIF